MSTTKPLRELLCVACGQRVAVSYYRPPPSERPNMAHDWCCMDDITIGEEGEPICKCGCPITFDMMRVRNC